MAIPIQRAARREASTHRERLSPFYFGEEVKLNRPLAVSLTGYERAERPRTFAAEKEGERLAAPPILPSLSVGPHKHAPRSVDYHNLLNSITP